MSPAGTPSQVLPRKNHQQEIGSKENQEVGLSGLFGDNSAEPVPECEQKQEMNGPLVLRRGLNDLFTSIFRAFCNGVLLS